MLATSILSPTLVVDGVFGYTPYHSWVGPEGPEDECWGDHFAIPNACQPPRSRDRAAPQFNMGGWALVTPSQMRDYADNQMQFSGNAGWTKGTHNVKFGFDVQHNYLNHYETQVPVFTFNGGATALSGGTAPNNFNQFADFLLGLPQSRNAQVMTPLLDTDGAKGAEWPATVRGWAAGLYLRDQWQITPKMTASIGVRWEYYPFPTRTDRGLEMFDFDTEPAPGLRDRRREFRRCATSRCRRISSRRGSAGPTGRPTIPSFASASPATRKATTRLAASAASRRRFRR